MSLYPEGRYFLSIEDRMNKAIFFGNTSPLIYEPKYFVGFIKDFIYDKEKY